MFRNLGNDYFIIMNYNELYMNNNKKFRKLEWLQQTIRIHENMREIEKELEQKKIENTLYNPRIALYRQQVADITSQLDGDISDETRAALLEEQQILNRRISDMIPHDIFSPHQKLWFEKAQKNYELQKPAFRSAEKYQHITDYGTLIPDGPPLDVVRKRSRKQREKLIRKQKTDENRRHV